MKEESVKPNTNHRDAVAKIAHALDSALVAAVDRMDEHPDDDLDRIIVSLAEARAYTVKAGMLAIVADNVIAVADDRARVYGDEVAPDYGKSLATAIDKSKALPALREQGHPKPPKKARGWPKGVKYKPGIASKLKSPKDFECPTCGAEAGTNCFKFSGPGTKGEVTDVRNDGTFHHIARAELSREANMRIKRENIQK
jgi:hypothetical protein